MIRIFYKKTSDGEKVYHSRYDTVLSALKKLASGWSSDRYYKVSIDDDETGFVHLNWVHPLDIDPRLLMDVTIYPSTQHLNETTQMAAKTAFEYTVILHALPSKDNAGNDTTPDSAIIIGPDTVVAVEEAHVIKIASRKIDTKISDSDLGRVQIKVRAL